YSVGGEERRVVASRCLEPREERAAYPEQRCPLARREKRRDEGMIDLIGHRVRNARLLECVTTGERSCALPCLFPPPSRPPNDLSRLRPRHPSVTHHRYTVNEDVLDADR